jgi:D-alanyl-D-alanine-carboxypeptidase/D-alanyl-D-alanine-endopeptidase
VRLDEPVAELLPAGMELPAEARGITLRQLTTHTSGLPSLPGNFSFWHTLGKMMTGGNPYDDYTEADFREGVRSVELDAKPGTEFEYSNFGMDLLGYALAQKAGMGYEAYIKQQVCEPLGMQDTTVTLSAEQKQRFVQGFVSVSTLGRLIHYDRAAPWDLPSHLAGAGALRSSAADMLIYLKANMRPQGPLANAIRTTHRELYRGEEGPVIGMNWIRSWNPSLGQWIIWHNGETGGFRSFLGFGADGRVGVVILSNVADESVDELGEAVLSDLSEQPAGNP